MDRTLRSFLQQADSLHDYLEKFCISLTAEAIEEKVVELQSAIRILQSVSYQMANVSNIANTIVHRKKRAANRMLTSEYIDPLPRETDIGTLRSLYPEKSIEVIKGVNIPVKCVDTISHIPTAHIYYVADLKQYAINIGGIVIRGNLSNIVEYQTENSAKCEYGANCKSIVAKTKCTYYHDPLDYINNNLPVPDDTRNLTTGSWIYSKKKTPRTYFMRHLGSKDRLMYDLNTLKAVQYRDEICNREQQLIHDLLIYMILNAKGLLERYPHWRYIK